MYYQVVCIEHQWLAVHADVGVPARRHVHGHVYRHSVSTLMLIYVSEATKATPLSVKLASSSSSLSYLRMKPVYRRGCKRVCRRFVQTFCAAACADVCADMYTDVCAGVCADMHADVCADVRADMCTDVCADMRTDACADLCADMCADVCVCRRVYSEYNTYAKRLMGTRYHHGSTRLEEVLAPCGVVADHSRSITATVRVVHASAC